MKRIIAIILTALMLMSTFTFLVGAEGSEESSSSKYTYNTSNATPTMDYEKGHKRTNLLQNILITCIIRNNISLPNNYK